MKMERKICEECKGKIIKKKVEFKLYGETLGKFPAEVCLKCGEKVFDEETSDKIDEIAKKKGLWGLDAQTKINKVGTSIIVCAITQKENKVIRSTPDANPSTPSVILTALAKATIVKVEKIR